MPSITYDDKDKNQTDGRELFTDADANEIKAVVNQKQDATYPESVVLDVDVKEHFTGSAITPQLIQTTTGTGASSFSGTPDDGGHPGINVMHTGTSATAKVIISSQQIRLRFGKITVHGRFRVPILSAAGQIFEVGVGIMDADAFSGFSNGVGLFIETTSSPRFQLIKNNGTGATTVFVGTAGAGQGDVAANSWVDCKLEILADGSVKASVFVNGQLFTANSNNTKVPLSSITGMTLRAGISKGSGTTDRTVEWDFLRFRVESTNPIP